MQVRQQGLVVQLIRSPYDKSKKRCVQQVIHTFDKNLVYTFEKSNPTLDGFLSAQPGRMIKINGELKEGKAGKSDACPALNDAERDELTRYLSEAVTAREAEKSGQALDLVLLNSERLADKINSEGIDKSDAEKAWAALLILEKALKKQGFLKSSMKPA